MARSLSQLTVLITLATLAVGCGEPKIGDTGVIVRGQVVKGGAAMQVQRRDIGLGSVDIHLIPEDESVESQMVFAEEDGSFLMVGAGEGIAPGKYRLAVYQNDQGPGTDLLKGKFSTETSPISIDVPSDKIGGELDLGTIELDDHN